MASQHGGTNTIQKRFYETCSHPLLAHPSPLRGLPGGYFIYMVALFLKFYDCLLNTRRLLGSCTTLLGKFCLCLCVNMSSNIRQLSRQYPF